MAYRFPVFIFILFILIFVSCKSRELSPEEKAKVNELKVQLEKIQSEISEAAADNESYQGGLIKTLIKTRIEILKTNEALIEQRINSIEAGAPVTIETKTYKPDAERLNQIEKEIETANQDIEKAKSEANQYSGGLIHSIKLSEVASLELNLAMLKQKYIEAKYGSMIPSIDQGDSPQQIENQISSVDEVDTNEEESNEVGTIEEYDEKGDFRRARWGMTKEEVKASEKSKLTLERDNEIDYIGTVGLLDAQIGFVFADNKLTNAGYIFQEKHSNRNGYIHDYNKIKKILLDKYGEPKKDEVIWKNSLYKDRPEDYGFAVSLGHLVYISKWKTDTTQIELTLWGDNFDVNHMLVYKSIELQPLLESKEKEAQEKDF